MHNASAFTIGAGITIWYLIIPASYHTVCAPNGTTVCYNNSARRLFAANYKELVIV